MNIKHISLLCALLAPMSIYANDAGTEAKKTSPFDHIGYNALASYTDFAFDSSLGDSYNRFFGYTNFYSIGASTIQLTPTVFTGISYLRVDTSSQSNLFFASSTPVHSAQTIHNNSIFGHLTKQLYPSVFVDFSGAYGQNVIHSESNLVTGGTSGATGYATSRSNAWFATVLGMYTHSWNKWLFSANARLLYSQMDAAGYEFNYFSSLPNQVVLPLTNKSYFSMENAEISYLIDTVKIPFSPFLNAGLIQVLDYRNSRPLIDPVLSGISPQLNLDKNAYRVGGGFFFRYKDFSVRLEEQYYNASQTYMSYQTLLSINYSS